MRLLRVIAFHLRGLVAGSSLDRDLDLELRDHIERETQANIARGLTPVEARRVALAAFGGVERYKDEARDVRAGHWVENRLHDVRYALRALRRAPGFAAVAILTLGLGVGATTAVFTVVNGVLLRPLPFRDPEQLYLASYAPFADPSLYDRFYLTYRDAQHSFERMSGYQSAEFTVSGDGDAVRVAGARVGADFFDLLGATPALGRWFTRDEDQPNGERVAVLSHRLWRERFGDDRVIAGKRITLDGVSYAVIGVAPPDFRFPASSTIWTPLALKLEAHNQFNFPVLGRLKNGVTPLEARAELTLFAESRGRDPGVRPRSPSVARIVPLKDVVTAGVERSLTVFSAAVLLVLLVAGVNLANLLLIRGAARRDEIALRASLGASRARLVCQLLTESVCLSVVGGVAGVMTAFAGVRALVALAPDGRIPRLGEVHVDGRVLAFALAVSVGIGILAGLVPALSSVRSDLQDALRERGRSAGRSHRRVRGRFVAAEIALAFVLLTGAGLMIRSFSRMRSVDTGYDAAGVVTMAVDLPSLAYGDAGRVRRFHDGLLERLSAIPGVNATGAVSYRPMGDMGIVGNFYVDGPTPLPGGYSVDKTTVSPGYFGAIGIRLISGRDFSSHDAAGASGAVVVSESVARAVWPGAEAVGKRISMGGDPGAHDWLTVIGVVKDVVQDGALKAHSTIYLPYLQTPQLYFLSHMTYVVRTAPGLAPPVKAIRAALHEMDPAVPAQALETMDASLLTVVAEPRFQTRLLTTFSLLALFLAAIGTYGVLAFDVAERTREIGIRIALGARAERVVRMVMGRTLVLAVAGVMIGAAGALLATRVLSRFLFEVSATDPATFGTVAVLLIGVACLAAMVPAWRAASVDPARSLKDD